MDNTSLRSRTAAGFTSNSPLSLTLTFTLSNRRSAALEDDYEIKADILGKSMDLFGEIFILVSEGR